MSEQQPTTTPPRPALDWRARSYLIWTALGALFGIFSGYLYNRAAKEYADRNGGKVPEPGTLEMMYLITAAVAMVSQIMELGRPNKPNKDRK